MFELQTLKKDIWDGYIDNVCRLDENVSKLKKVMSLIKDATTFSELEKGIAELRNVTELIDADTHILMSIDYYCGILKCLAEEHE